MEVPLRLCESVSGLSSQFLLNVLSYSTAYASFGGLLMSLTGSFRHMTNIVLGDPVYILLRK